MDRKKKTVCEKCSNEWMSQIVTDLAKPCTERMILSDSVIDLSPECVRSIAIYAFLKAVIGDHAKALNGKYLYTFTWGAGRLVIQLVSVKFINTRLRRKIVPLIGPDPFFDGQGYALPIWPPTGKEIVWPPLNHLSGPLLEAFSNRFARG